MVQNTIALIRDQLSDALVGKIAGFLGEDKYKVTSAVGSAIPRLSS
jgi:hypothetical protein